MDGLGGLVALAFLAALYFLPAIVAKTRGNPQFAAILVLNALLGWTFIGWVVAMVWAFVNSQARPSSPHTQPASKARPPSGFRSGDY